MQLTFESNKLECLCLILILASKLPLMCSTRVGTWGQRYKTNTLVIYCYFRLNYCSNFIILNLPWNDSILLWSFNPKMQGKLQQYFYNIAPKLRKNQFVNAVWGKSLWLITQTLKISKDWTFDNKQNRGQLYRKQYFDIL